MAVDKIALGEVAADAFDKRAITTATLPQATLQRLAAHVKVPGHGVDRCRSLGQSMHHVFPRTEWIRSYLRGAGPIIVRRTASSARRSLLSEPITVSPKVAPALWSQPFASYGGGLVRAKRWQMS